MRAQTRLVIAAALVIILCQQAPDQAAATVVRGDKGTSSNPATEVGGHRLPPQPPPPVPYSLIGAIASDGQWFDRCTFWPWRPPGSPSFHRFDWFGRPRAQPFSRSPLEWGPPPRP